MLTCASVREYTLNEESSGLLMTRLWDTSLHRRSTAKFS